MFLRAVSLHAFRDGVVFLHTEGQKETFFSSFGLVRELTAWFCQAMNCQVESFLVFLAHRAYVALIHL